MLIAAEGNVGREALFILFAQIIAIGLYRWRNSRLRIFGNGFISANNKIREIATSFQYGRM